MDKLTTWTSEMQQENGGANLLVLLWVLVHIPDGPKEVRPVQKMLVSFECNMAMLTSSCSKKISYLGELCCPASMYLIKSLHTCSRVFCTWALANWMCF